MAPSTESLAYPTERLIFRPATCGVRTTPMRFEVDRWTPNRLMRGEITLDAREAPISGGFRSAPVGVNRNAFALLTNRQGLVIRLNFAALPVLGGVHGHRAVTLRGAPLSFVALCEVLVLARRPLRPDESARTYFFAGDGSHDTLDCWSTTPFSYALNTAVAGRIAALAKRIWRTFPDADKIAADLVEGWEMTSALWALVGEPASDRLLDELADVSGGTRSRRSTRVGRKEIAAAVAPAITTDPEALDAAVNVWKTLRTSARPPIFADFSDDLFGPALTARRPFL